MYGMSVPVFQQTPIRPYLVIPPNNESVIISEFVKDLDICIVYT